MDDFRIRIGFTDHPKTRRLKRLLGPGAVEILIRLFEFCTVNPDRRDGTLTGLNGADLADLCRWEGPPAALVRGLKGAGFLDGASRRWEVHGWAEANPYVSSWKARSAQSKRAISRRWEKNKAEENQGAPIRSVCGPNTDRITKPYPSPSSSSSSYSITDPDPSSGAAASSVSPENVSDNNSIPIAEIEQRATEMGWPLLSSLQINRLHNLTPIDRFEASEAFKATEAQAVKKGYGYFIAVISGGRGRVAADAKASQTATEELGDEPF